MNRATRKEADCANIDISFSQFDQISPSSYSQVWILEDVTQQAYEVEITSYWCRCDVMTSHRRQYVISTTCARWKIVSLHSDQPVKTHLKKKEKKNTYTLKKRDILKITTNI